MAVNPPMTRTFLLALLALLGTLVTFTASTGVARAASQPYYKAELAQPAPKRVAVAGGVVWRCQGTTCTADKATARPERVCGKLAREFGTVTAFAMRGEPVSAETLAACNPAA